MLVQDVRKLESGTYGYCHCGRELKKGDSNKIECPLCNMELEWEEEDSGQVS